MITPPPERPLPNIPPPQQPPAFNPWDLLKLIPPAPEPQPQVRQPARRPAGDVRHPIRPQPREPTAEQLARLTHDQLRGLLSESVQKFGEQLDGVKTGDAWKAYFQLDDLEITLNTDSRTRMLSNRERSATFPERPTRDETASRDDQGTKLAGKRPPSRPTGPTREEGPTDDEDPGEVRGQRPGQFPERPTRDETASRDDQGGKLSGRRPGENNSRQQLVRTNGKEPGRDETSKKSGRELLATISNRFENVAEQAKYREISRLAGFQALQLGLREYLLSPRIRQGREFSRHLEVFRQTLTSERTGASWQKYFHTDEIEAVARSLESLKTADRELLEEVLERFDRVIQDESYARVKKAHGFQETHAALRSLVKAARLEAAENIVYSPPVNEDDGQGGHDE